MILVYVLTGLGWLLALAAGLVLLAAAALLFLPLDLSGRVDSDIGADTAGDVENGSLRWQLGLRFGWSVLAVDLVGRWLEIERAETRFLGRRLKSRRDTPSKQKQPRKQKKSKRLSVEVMRAFIQEGLRLLRRMWRGLGLRVSGDILYGFDDPAVTGMCEAVRWTAGLPESVKVKPDWLTPRLEGWFQFSGRIFGVEFLVALLSALKNPVLRHHVFAGLRSKLRGQKTPIGGSVS